MPQAREGPRDKKRKRSGEERKAKRAKTSHEDDLSGDKHGEEAIAYKPDAQTIVVEALETSDKKNKEPVEPISEAIEGSDKKKKRRKSIKGSGQEIVEDQGAEDATEQVEEEQSHGVEVEETKKTKEKKKKKRHSAITTNDEEVVVDEPRSTSLKSSKDSLPKQTQGSQGQVSTSKDNTQHKKAISSNEDGDTLLEAPIAETDDVPRKRGRRRSSGVMTSDKTQESREKVSAMLKAIQADIDGTGNKASTKQLIAHPSEAAGLSGNQAESVPQENWEMSAPVGGRFLDSEPVFTPDEKYDI